MNLKGNPISKSYKIRVGITMGDPSGIGPQITHKAIRKLQGLAEFVVIGDRWVFEKIKKSTTRPTETKPACRFIDLNNVRRKKFAFGNIKSEYGRASIEYLDKALELIKEKRIDCLVTCPISKQAINLAGFPFFGHTEYLAKCSGTKDFAMMLLNNALKICLVTRHIPLSRVSPSLNKGELEKIIFLTIKSLKRLFLIDRPRLAICGVNPHASDNGLIGSEENKIIKPVLQKFKNKTGCSIKLEPADVAIYKTKEKHYDCIIAMYHDQALISLKLTGRDTGVNLTLGLPYVRTSPLHGTAFDIAQTNLADPSSLIAAIKTAVQCTLNLKKA